MAGRKDGRSQTALSSASYKDPVVDVNSQLRFDVNFINLTLKTQTATLLMCLEGDQRDFNNGDHSIGDAPSALRKCIAGKIAAPPIIDVRV